MSDPSLTLLAAFEAVARRGGFRAAARELNQSASSVSEAVARLEAAMGTRLLARTTRAVAPTPAGARLLARLTPALNDLRESVDEARAEGGRVGGLLRLTASRSPAQLALSPILPGFLAAYPEIKVEIVVEDAFVDLVARGFDAGVRLGEALEQDMISIAIGPPQRGAIVGAPSYFARNAPPKTPQDLEGHARLARRMASGAVYAWEFEKDGVALRVEPSGPLIVNDNELLLDAARAGLGLAHAFEESVRRDVEEGRLVQVLQDWLPPFDGLKLYYPSRAGMRPALRAFVDFAVSTRRTTRSA